MSAQSQPEPKPEIAGVTVDSKGKPLRKTDLMLVSLATNAVGDPMPAYATVSEDDGKFEFYGVPSGRYRLLADHAGYLRTRYGAKTPRGSGAVLTLRQGAPITGLEVRMPEQAVISGKVLYDGPAGSTLMLLQQNYQSGRRQMASISSATVELSGEFLFNRLAPGRYYLLARPALDPGDDEKMGVSTYYPGTTDQSAAEPIIVKAGQSASVGFQVKKSRQFRVSGTVSGLTPTAARPSVLMRAAADNFAGGAWSAAVATDGTFELTRVPPGSYLIMASIPGGPAPRVVQQAIEVHGDVSGVVLIPEQCPVLQGALKVEGEGALPRLRVVLAPAVTLPFSSPAAQAGADVIWIMSVAPNRSPFSNPAAQAGADGSLTFGPVLPGRYRYQFLDLPPGAYLKSAKFGENDALFEVDLTQPDPNARLNLVISYAGGLIEGAVLDEQRKPVDGVVTLIPDPPQPQRTSLYQLVEADENGRFQFQGLRPGKYRLYAWEEFEAGAQFDPDVTGPFQARSVAVEAADGARKEVAVTRISVDEMEAARKPR
jgi:hypothetical protein